jgi:hypothetical protein
MADLDDFLAAAEAEEEAQRGGPIQSKHDFDSRWSAAMTKRKEKVAAYRKDKKLKPQELSLTGALSGEEDERPESIPLPLRFFAAMKMSPAGTVNYLKSKYGDGNVKGEIKNGELVNVRILHEGKPLVLDPQGPDVGDFTADAGGSFIESVPEMAMAAGTGGGSVAKGLISRAAKGAAKGIAADTIGVAARAAASRFLPGDDEMDMRDYLTHGATSVAAGGAGRALTSTAGAAIKGVAGIMSPGKKLAKEFAQEAATPSARSLAGKTQRSYFDDSQQIAKEVSDLAGKPFSFDAAQATGAKSLQTAKRTLSQTPEHMDRLYLEKQKQLTTFATAADKTIERAAANPNALDSADVGNAVAETVTQYVNKLKDIRRTVAGKLYGEADQMLGANRVIPTTNALAKARDVLADKSFYPDEATAGLASMVKKIEDASSQGGRINMKQFQDMRSAWRDMLHDGDVITGLDKANQQRIARMVLDAMDADLEKAGTAPVLKNAISKFREADEAYARLSQPINDVATKAISRLLKLQDETPEMIVGQIRKMTGPQVTNLMKVVDKTSPASAQQLRASVLREVFSEGTAVKNADDLFGADLSSAAVSPVKFITTMRNNAETLVALFGNDKATAGRLRTLIAAADRLASGPDIAGSDTVAKALSLGVIDAAKREGNRGILQMMQGKLMDTASDVLMRPGAVADLLSTSGGVKAFQAMIENALNPPKTKELAAKAMKQMMPAISKLGWLGARDAVIPDSYKEKPEAPLPQDSVAGGDNDATPTSVRTP